MLILRLISQDEGHLYANFSLFILTIYRKFLLVEFFGRGLRMHLPILTDFQKGRTLAFGKLVIYC